MIQLSEYTPVGTNSLFALQKGARLKEENVLRFVGVTGLPAAGKGAFIEIFRSLLHEQQIETRYYSLSDELRAEARRRGQTVERPVLRQIANQLRLEQGSGVLSLLVSRKLKQEVATLPAGTRLVAIVDAIRNPEEVAVLRQELGSRFVLVGVEAPLELLVTRIAARARFDEPEAFVKQKEAARRMIQGESGQGEPAHGHNISQCVAQADWRIDNSASLQALTTQAQRFVDEMVVGEDGNK